LSADLWSAIAARCERAPAAAALLWRDPTAGADVTLSYADLAERAAALAAGLRDLGVGAADRVAVALPNSPDVVALLLATLRLGATYVPLNPAYTAEEVGWIAANVGALVVVAHATLREALAAAPASAGRIVGAVAPGSKPPAPATIAPSAPALIVYTSGTTGRPKGAVLSHRALRDNLRAILRGWEWTSEDRLLLTLPCSHLHGLALGVLGSLLHGSSLVLRARFAAEEALADLERLGCTAMFGVPTMYNRLVQLPAGAIHRHDLARVRLWACGSAPLLATTFERFRELFGTTLVERFGMSEGGFMLAAPYHGVRRAGVVGRPVEGVEVRIVDEDEVDAGRLADVADGNAGELLVRGGNLFDGYWNDPAATAAAFVDGWFRTGDQALRESDGQLRILGRRSADILKVRGYKVSAVEIEDRLQSLPGVREVAVVGLPHADWGQEIVAVVAADARESGDALRLQDQARTLLAPYKVPNRIVFVDEIPKVGPGKYRKQELVRTLTCTP